MKDTDYEMAYWADSWDELPIAPSPETVGRIVPGTANLSSDHVILEQPLIPATDFSSEPGEKKAYLYGFSRSGDYLVIKDTIETGSKRSYPGQAERTLQADYLFAAKHPFNCDDHVTEARVELTALDNWAGKFWKCAPSTLEGKQRFELVYDPCDEEQVLFTDKRYEIKIRHDFTESGTIKGMKVKHKCKLEITFRTETSFEDTISMAHTLSEFFTLCTGFYVSVESLELKFSESISYVNCHGHFIDGGTPKNKDIATMLFNYQLLRDSMQNLLGNWIGASEDLRRAGQMTGSLMSSSWHMPYTLQFVAVSQALELLADLNAVSTNKRGRNSEKQLEDLLGEYTVYAQWLLPDINKFAHCQNRERDYHVHQKIGRSKEPLYEPEDLFYHSEAAHLLCYGVIWCMLGLDETEIVKALKNTGYKSFLVTHARDLYAK